MGSCGSVDERKCYVNQPCDDTETSYDDCSDTFKRFQSIHVVLSTHCSLLCGIGLMNVEV